MHLPWWVWVILGLWCGPGVYCTITLLMQKPIPGLTEEREPVRPIPLRVKVMMFPLLLVVLAATWPSAVWTEMGEGRLLVKVLKFPFWIAFVVVIWPVLLWREVKESRR